ncbi:FG-GAP-like repeat-containing protein [Schlesneria sp. T3-172]|uniref:FG-GAP-like repeat-containing protein n=1 Tax=Schlesneria sphaerica TaxID=3373610 RepID=UPI0037C52A8F
MTSAKSWGTGPLFTGVTFVAVSVCILGWLATREWLSSDELFRRGIEAVEQKRIADAERYAARLLKQDSQSSEAIYLIALTLRETGSWREATDHFNRIPDDGSSISVKARCAAGDLYLFRGFQLSKAEGMFRRALKQNPLHAEAHNRMAYILGLQSRNYEALPHRLALINSGSPTETDIYLIALGDRAMDDPKVITQYLSHNDSDPAAILGWGRLMAEQGHQLQAERAFRTALRSPAHASEALSRWGLMMITDESTKDIPEWWDASRQENHHPGIWYVRAVLASRRGEAMSAARCYWEVLRRDPEQATASYRLGQHLLQLGRNSEAETFLQRASLLEEYARAAELAFRVGEEFHLKLAQKAAHRCGLEVEHTAWTRILAGFQQKKGSVPRRVTEPAFVAGEILTRSHPGSSPALQIDLSDWAWDKPSSSESASSLSKVQPIAESSIQFEDSTASATLSFQFINGGSPAEGIKHMFEVTGGGVSVIDFDRDEWPDLYFPQGGDWPAGTERTETDRLHRNLGNGSFRDVTEYAGLVERGFSQGASIGDINGDGFPDIYVANSEADRLFLNQGDGTFMDVTQQARIGDHDYGASAVIADFSGDGFPDIYVVNYLAGDDLWDRVCGGSDGIARSCLPQSFPGSHDRFYLNQGDGSFDDRTSSAGVGNFVGKGLGVIAARFPNSGPLELYIANDVGPNFLLHNTPSADGLEPHFTDEGLVSGSALNADGRIQSGMGVAAGDIDGNGLIDLFVTNFEGETNTLYLQTEPSQFEDASVRSGLADPKRNLVGWGTQFLDADLDGWLDIAITNGHVNNLSDIGKPYQMRPALFRNLGGGQMVPLTPAKVGDYFERSYLGRGMALLDWNRDGYEDMVITHLDVPAALLTNRTSPTAHGIRLFFSGTNCERDAIGTVVRIKTGARTIVRQLTAGDGNQSTNQRCIVIGCADDSTVDSIIVEWPNGFVQSFSSLKLNCDYRIIEGTKTPYLLRSWK